MKMEFQKIVNFLDTTSDDKDLPRFVTKNRLKFMINQKKNYSPNKEIRIKASMLRSDLCDFNDVYLKAVAFKNNAPFINCISKINGVKLIMQKIQML